MILSVTRNINNGCCNKNKNNNPKACQEKFLFRGIIKKVSILRKINTGEKRRRKDELLSQENKQETDVLFSYHACFAVSHLSRKRSYLEIKPSRKYPYDRGWE
mmetsp:Transcript_9253/g.19223  ORF Transcript_9253/g.19223 Transcript_9253/m.19223 type:complete len:103 (-) Transcript_9253:304-612(-)